MSRVDRILEELRNRYSLPDKFLHQVRPMVETILSPESSEPTRTRLLEELAATCQRDLALRNAQDGLKESLVALFRRLAPPPGADGETAG